MCTHKTALIKCVLVFFLNLCNSKSQKLEVISISLGSSNYRGVAVIQKLIYRLKIYFYIHKRVQCSILGPLKTDKITRKNCVIRINERLAVPLKLKAHANGQNKSQHCCVSLGVFGQQCCVRLHGPKNLTGFKCQQVPTLSWFHANGRNKLDPTMLRVVGQQCRLRPFASAFTTRKMCHSNQRKSYIIIS